MKKILLVLFLVFSVAAVQAQQNVLVNDSIYVFGGTAEPALEDLLFYQYDSACRRTAEQDKIRDPFSGDVRNFKQNLYSYDTAGRLYQFTSQDWDDTSYMNTQRATYTYDSKGQTTSSLTENWIDSSFWQPNSYSTTTFDATGNITNQVTQYYNTDSMKLINVSESKYEFNSSKKDTAVISLQWNNATQTWVPVTQVLSYYDNNGLLVKTEQQNWDGTLWESQTVTYYYNNSKGNIDSSILTFAMNPSEIDKYYYVYDSATSALTQTSSYFYNSGELISAYRNSFFHDTTAVFQTDTTITEILVNDSFVVSYQNAFTLYFNTDHSVKENIISSDWADENSSFGLDNRYTYALCQSVLPVSLLSFTGKQKNDDALLQWQTTNEVNTSYFTVQRSVDGIHFTPVGKVTASGNSSAVKNYSYTDKNITSLSANKFYYRLESTDNNGSISYSKIAALNIVTGKLIVYASPNPVSDKLSIYSSVSLPGAVVKIWDMSGRLLYASQQNITAGNKLAIDMSAFAKGMYVITVQSATEKYECKIAKQ